MSRRCQHAATPAHFWAGATACAKTSAGWSPDGLEREPGQAPEQAQPAQHWLPICPLHQSVSVFVLVIERRHQKQLWAIPAQLMPVKLHCVGVPAVVFDAVNTSPVFDGAVNGVNAAIVPLLICSFVIA